MTSTSRERQLADEVVRDLRLAIHAWIRDDVPLAGKLNLLPEHVAALVSRIATLRAAPAPSEANSSERPQPLTGPVAIKAVPATDGAGLAEPDRPASLATSSPNGDADRNAAAQRRIGELWPPEAEFQPGEPVEKHLGEARWHGTIRSAYLTGKGSLRYVVEVSPQGFQMIAVPGQLRRAAALLDKDQNHDR